MASLYNQKNNPAIISTTVPPITDITEIFLLKKTTAAMPNIYIKKPKKQIKSAAEKDFLA